MLKMSDAFAKYHCNYCEEDINGLRVRCLECEDFDLCLQCFACGAEIGKHKPYHGYQFMASVFQDTGNFSIFPGQGQWSAREEVRLLDAIEQYGFGNWDDISAHIETKTPEEARVKYITNYIEGNVGRCTWKASADTYKTLPLENVTTDTGPLSPTLGSSLPSTPLPQEETSTLGYMFLRDDFEREWDNEAENAVAPLFIHPVDDEDVDKALKLAQVDMYTRRLRERARRKRVIRDFQLVQQFAKKEKERASQHPFKRKIKEDKEYLSEKLRPIAQFYTAVEFQNLINSMSRERELKIRIRELNRYRRNGIHHVEECSEFEVARSRREKKKEVKKKMGNLPQTPMNHGEQTLKRENEEKKRDLAELRFTALDTGVGKWPNERCSGSPTSQGSQLHREIEDAVSISSLPGFHLLSTKERKLCASINMKPSQYISYKTVLLKENFEKRMGFESTVQRTAVVGLDSKSHLAISNFLTRAGWIYSF